MAWPRCDECDGTGQDPRDPDSACATCGGRGYILPKRWARRDTDDDAHDADREMGIREWETEP